MASTKDTKILKSAFYSRQIRVDLECFVAKSYKDRIALFFKKKEVFCYRRNNEKLYFYGLELPTLKHWSVVSEKEKEKVKEILNDDKINEKINDSNIKKYRNCFAVVESGIFEILIDPLGKHVAKISDFKRKIKDSDGWVKVSKENSKKMKNLLNKCGIEYDPNVYVIRENVNFIGLMKGDKKEYWIEKKSGKMFSKNGKVTEEMVSNFDFLRTYLKDLDYSKYIFSNVKVSLDGESKSQFNVAVKYVFQSGVLLKNVLIDKNMGKEKVKDLVIPRKNSAIEVSSEAWFERFVKSEVSEIILKYAADIRDFRKKTSNINMTVKPNSLKYLINSDVRNEKIKNVMIMEDCIKFTFAFSNDVFVVKSVKNDWVVEDPFGSTLRSINLNSESMIDICENNKDKTISYIIDGNKFIVDILTKYGLRSSVKCIGNLALQAVEGKICELNKKEEKLIETVKSSVAYGSAITEALIEYLKYLKDNRRAGVNVKHWYNGNENRFVVAENHSVGKKIRDCMDSDGWLDSPYIDLISEDVLINILNSLLLVGAINVLKGRMTLGNSYIVELLINLDSDKKDRHTDCDWFNCINDIDYNEEVSESECFELLDRKTLFCIYPMDFIDFVKKYVPKEKIISYCNIMSDMEKIEKIGDTKDSLYWALVSEIASIDQTDEDLLANGYLAGEHIFMPDIIKEIALMEGLDPLINMFMLY